MITVILRSTIILAIVSGYQHQICQELRRAAERRLVEQAVTDGLTGLRNRAGITQVLRHRMAELKQSGHSAGIVMFDLDHFKRINDTHGHDEGDRFLVSLARCLEPLLGLGRWGGEGFLLSDLRQLEELTQLVERLRVAIYDLSRETGKH
jgi:diguanylate cyclase (GGDEF)-like protein